MAAYPQAARHLLTGIGLDGATMDREQAELLDRLAELRARKHNGIAARLALAGAVVALDRAKKLAGAE